MEFAEPGREESLGAVMDLAGQPCETSPLLRRANPQVPVIKRKSAGPGPVHVRSDGHESDDESTDDDQDLDNQQQQDDPRDQIPSSRKHERLGALRYPRVKQPALQPTGLAQRKPRWPGISAATQAPSSVSVLAHWKISGDAVGSCYRACNRRRRWTRTTRTRTSHGSTREGTGPGRPESSARRWPS